MPRRAAAPDREAIEAALTDGERAVLRDWCRLFDVSEKGWHRTPIAPMFVQAVIIRRAAALVAQGMAPDTAMCRAAYELDIAPTTIRSRATRWSAYSREGLYALCAGAHRVSASDLVEHETEDAR